MSNNLKDTFGNIDIYLFDQLLKGRYDQCRRIIDVGCGGGRNLVYFLRQGYEVWGVDPDASAVASVQALAAQLMPGYAAERFVVARAEAMPFADASFDLAICSAVLHFATDADHFGQMLRAMWRVLQPGGYFFARLASDIGLETQVTPVGNGRYLLPDGSVRYLVNAAMLENYMRELGATLYEPIKTTIVDNQRCMTTWCMRKAG